MAHLLLFTIDGQDFGIELSSVERVVWAVAVTPLSQAPDCVDGVINIQGDVIPVFNMRKSLGLPIREMELCDQLLICRFANQLVALWIDAVVKVLHCDPAELLLGSEVFPEMEMLAFVLKQKGKVVLIYDWPQLLAKETVHVRQ